MRSDEIAKDIDRDAVQLGEPLRELQQDGCGDFSLVAFKEATGKLAGDLLHGEERAVDARKAVRKTDGARSWVSGFGNDF